MKKYSGQDVAVLWSGGFDSTFLALQLAEAGASVTCVCDVSISLSKLGDTLNRMKVKPLLDKAGVTIQMCHLEHYKSKGEDRYSTYSRVLERIVQHTRSILPEHTIVSGVLKSDTQCNEITEVLKTHNVEMPLVEYTYAEYQNMKFAEYGKNPAMALLSRCDNGQILTDKQHAPCSEAKSRERWCFKCHEDGKEAINDLYNSNLLADALMSMYPGEEVGGLLGYVVAGRMNQKPSFAARQRDGGVGDVIKGDFPVKLQLTERNNLRKDSSTLLKTAIVDIYLSDLKRMMGERITESLVQNSITAELLIKDLVEHNYLPVGYDWDIHLIKILWSEI